MSMLFICGACVDQLVAKAALDTSSEESLCLLVKATVLDQPIVGKKQGLDQYEAFVEDEDLKISRDNDI